MTLPIAKTSPPKKAFGATRQRMLDWTSSGGIPWDFDALWISMDFSENIFTQLGNADILRVLSGLSPDVSKALWDYNRMINPGYTIKALRDGKVDEAAQLALEQVLEEHIKAWGSIEALISQFVSSFFIYGAIASDLRESENSWLVEPLSPVTIRFKKGGETGLPWIAHQLEATGSYQLKKIESRYFLYSALDPIVGQPYGSPIAGPVAFTSVFLLSLVRDLRRVISQQGYPRIDIAVDVEKLIQNSPPEVASDPDALSDWVNSLMDEIATVYAKLEPDSAYIHSDVVAVNSPVGLSGNALDSLDEFIAVLERWTLRSLKTTQILMSSVETLSKEGATRQWEVFLTGIRNLQKLISAALSTQFTRILAIAGIRSKVVFELEALTISEQMRYAQVLSIVISNAQRMYLAGWISQDEASMMAVNKTAYLPEPLQLPSALGPFPEVTSPDFSDEPGSDHDQVAEAQG